MPIKKTEAITREEFEEIVNTIRDGYTGHRASDKIATILTAQANLGLRIGDLLNLRLCDIVWSYDRYHIEIIEQKTEKKRDFTVHVTIYEYLKAYAKRHNIKDDEILFDISARRVNQAINDVVDFLGLDTSKIASHSFRKFFATQIYVNNDYNIALVQKLLQHSSPSITQHYIGIQQKEIEKALENNVMIPESNSSSKNIPKPKGKKAQIAKKEREKQLEKELDKEVKKEILKRMLQELEDK